MSELEELRAQVAALTRQVDAARKLVEVIEDKNRRWVARAESAEARITAAWDLVVEDGRFTSDLARAVRAALREPVEEPQPEGKLNMDQDEANEHARPDRTEIPPEPMSDGERLAYMGTDAARWTDQFLGTLRWSPDGTAALDWGHVLGWFANAIEAGRAALRDPVGEPQPRMMQSRWPSVPGAATVALDEVGEPQPEPCANRCINGRVFIDYDDGHAGGFPHWDVCPSCSPKENEK